VSEHWEWGVKHGQGIRTESSEKTARESLEWMTRAHERNRRSVKPYIVRRRVTDWEPLNEELES
jgi:hypothetical protein